MYIYIYIDVLLYVYIYKLLEKKGNRKNFIEAISRMSSTTIKGILWGENHEVVGDYDTEKSISQLDLCLI